MSSLSDFCSHKVQHNPCEPRGCSAGFPDDARRMMRALREGHTVPPLGCALYEQTPCSAGMWESARTVEEKLEFREDFPT